MDTQPETHKYYNQVQIFTLIINILHQSSTKKCIHITRCCIVCWTRHPPQCRGTKTFASDCLNTVQCGPGKRGHLLSTEDCATFIWGAVLFPIINRHTKLWAPNNTAQIPLCAQVSAQRFGVAACVPSTAPSPFQIPAHEWKMARTQRISSTFLFLPFCEAGPY